MDVQTAIFGAGCFWGVQQILRDIPGVIRTEVGYSGGTSPNPTYNDVKTGTTGHAEAVKIEFNPALLSYRDLLGYFFRLHDPTTFNRQGNDLGSQYRSVIFYFNDDQKQSAEMIKKDVESSGKWKRPVVTQIVPAAPFYSAETYHQDYLVKNPDGYNCHFLRD